jgi:hypothetical protein
VDLPTACRESAARLRASDLVAPAVLDKGISDAAELVERLVDAQLVEELREDELGHAGYGFQDLWRLFAREEAEADQATRAPGLSTLLVDPHLVACRRDRRLSRLGRPLGDWRRTRTSLCSQLRMTVIAMSRRASSAVSGNLHGRSILGRSANQLKAALAIFREPSEHLGQGQSLHTLVGVLVGSGCGRRSLRATWRW